MAENVTKDNVDESLWVLTRLKESTVAIDGTCVEAILVQEDDIIRLPTSDNVHIGMISFRGGFVPITDLRVLMGMRSYFDEMEEFDDMLEQRKQDHIRWVQELERCLANDEPFPLATDPHKCAFGRWYDNYQPIDGMVAFTLKKIDEPHRKLHQTAVDAFNCDQNHEACQRNICLKSALRSAAEVYMPTVVGLLEETKQVFRDSYRKMMVVVSHGESSCALLVDEVLSAEPLVSMRDSLQVGGGGEHPLVTHIAQRKGDDSQILVLSLDRLFAVPA